MKEQELSTQSLRITQKSRAAQNVPAFFSQLIFFQPYARAVAINSFILFSWFTVLTLAS